MTQDQTEALRQFAVGVLRYAIDCREIDVDDLREWGHDLGVVVEVMVTEPCGELCGCAESGAFDYEDVCSDGGATCYRIAPFVLGQEALPFDDGEAL